MADRQHLLWAAWRCLRRTHQGVAVEPFEVLHGWHLCRPCDQLLLDQFKACSATALPWGQPGDPEGPALVALLRELMAADQPPAAPTRGPCPVCQGKRSIGPVHINRSRQPHQWVTVPCHRCVGPADEPEGRLVQAVVDEAAGDPVPASPPAAPPTPPAPTKPAPAATAGQMALF